MKVIMGLLSDLPKAALDTAVDVDHNLPAFHGLEAF